MKRKNAFTLIELIVAMAILVIIVGMITPLMTSITKSNKKTQEINELDLNLGKSIDIFKSAVRSSKPISSGTSWNVTGIAIYLSDNSGIPTTSAISNAIVVNVPKEISADTYEDEKVIFYLSGTNLMLNSTHESVDDDFIGVTRPVELVKNVQSAKFTYSSNIATIYLKVQMDKNDVNNFKEIRDAAVTRINIEF